MFVGGGVQRKGLHHLLYAWQRANLPSDSQLTLVCRSIQPELAALADDTSRTTLRRGVTFETLLSLYRGHTLFAMPSLIEGFGQVFLEAMSQGCPVLGTLNTCLPDVQSDKDIVHTVKPGNLDALVSTLEHLSSTLPGERTPRLRARERAQHFTWSRFRSRIIDAT
ncbi:glycosyltransferase [Salinibacter ruber]|uniref:glycosyltransferase n=1 Tax=Salinibacter ruber TaxID=146919 RepID=UPI003C6E51A8